MASPLPRPGPIAVLVLLGLAAGAVALAFLTVGARGRWEFVLAFRGTKLAAMLVVGCAVATATVLFQTVTDNRILTPGLMGLDALYLLIQTATVFTLGPRGLGLTEGPVAFLVQSAILIGVSATLFRALLTGRAGSLPLLLLAGLMGGALFRSLAALMQRTLDPNDFAILQSRTFASFNAIHTDLLGLAAAAVALCGVAVWRLLPVLDVLLLGREAAVGLGVDVRRSTATALMLAAALTAVATALVGPVTFLGLLVANLAYAAVPTYRHALVLPAACLVAAITLVAGQLVLERVLHLDATLGIVVEFVGGIVFLALLVRRGRP